MYEAWFLKLEVEQTWLGLSHKTHQAGPLLLPQLLGMLSGGCAEWLWEGGPNQEPSKWRGQDNGGYPGEHLCVDLGKEKEAARKV